jgi:hypothetical protein
MERQRFPQAYPQSVENAASPVSTMKIQIVRARASFNCRKRKSGKAPQTEVKE